MSRRWTPAPGPAEFVFAAVLGLLLAGGLPRLLQDPGIFWHLRLGRDLLATGTLPRADALTVAGAGRPWIDPYWAWDAGLAAVVDGLGWPVAAALVAVALAALYADVARTLLREGAAPPVALGVAMVALGLAAPHLHARPHVATMVLAWAVLRLLRAHHRDGGRAVWVVPGLVAVWANLHGGFLAGPILVACALAGERLSRPGDPRRARTFAAVLVLSLVAPMAGPYGTAVYGHAHAIVRGARVTDLIDEWQPVAFGAPRAFLMEATVLALVALPVLGRGRPSRFDLVPALAWLHLALGGQRHAPLFGLAVAPVLAALIEGMRAEVATATAPVPAPRSPLPALLGAAVLVLAAGGYLRGDPDPARWPLAGLAAVDRLDPAVPLFHELEWGGLIACEALGGRRPFLDDRFELHGRDRILGYMDAQAGGPGWDVLQARERFGAAWLRPGRPLARRLAAEPGWRVAYRDRRCVLLVREPHGGSGHPAGTLAGPPDHPTRTDDAPACCTPSTSSSSPPTSSAARSSAPASGRVPAGG
jgi:hypothetical protein